VIQETQDKDYLNFEDGMSKQAPVPADDDDDDDDDVNEAEDVFFQRSQQKPLWVVVENISRDLTHSTTLHPFPRGTLTRLQFARMTMAPKRNQTAADAPLNRVTIWNVTAFVGQPRKSDFPRSDRLLPCPAPAHRPPVLVNNELK
jgi:hypothetical protein